MSTITSDDQHFLTRAVALSRAHMQAGHGGPFGAVIVAGGAIIAEGWNAVTSVSDPTAHAEVMAIRRACAARADFKLDGATIYASAEPCPMCLAAIHWARLARLVFANTRDEAAAIGFDDAWLYAELAKPPANRALPATHLPLPEAKAVFAEWAAKPDKVSY